MAPTRPQKVRVRLGNALRFTFYTRDGRAVHSLKEAGLPPFVPDRHEAEQRGRPRVDSLNIRSRARLRQWRLAAEVRIRILRGIPAYRAYEEVGRRFHASDATVRRAFIALDGFAALARWPARYRAAIEEASRIRFFENS